MARKLVLVLTLIVTFYTTGAHALGMGNIAVQSKLNQPLLAKIKLMSIPRGQIGSIKVSLASREAFDRAGLERPHLLSTMRYKVIQAKNKRSATIRITTSQPIKEPFLNFLLEVNWPSGRLLREYTVLLDPPVFSSKRKPAPLQVPTAQRTPLPRTPLPSPPAPAKPPAPAVTLSMPAERRVRAVPSAPRIHAYTTVKNDTLWVIAKRMMADNPSMSHHQMMVMLFEANQHAFIRGNMNRLKTGQNLNIPAPEAATGMSQKSALRVFREHDAVWRGYRRSVAATPTRTPRTAARRAKAAGMKTASVGEPTAFFQVRPAFTKRGKDAGAAETPPVEDNSSTELGKMRAELAGLRKINTGLQEENTRIQLKNKQLDEDLKATRDVVEDLNSKVNKLITVQNNLYERLQEQIAQLGTLKEKQPTEIQKTGNEILSKFERPGQPPVESEPAAPQPAGSESEPVESEPAAPQPAGSESEPVESEPAASQPAGSESEPVESESAAPQPAGSESEEPVESEPAAPQPAEPAAESWINAVPGGWLTLGGVLAAVAGVGGLFGFRKLRKKKQQAEAQQGEEELKALEEAGMLPETGAAGAEGAPASGDAAAAGTADTQPDENIMEEVDVFIAYERFDQAGNIIDSAIEKHPEHHPYLLKRLEVDATANDAASFEQHAQKLHSAVQGKGPLWEQAQSLWQGMGTGTPLLGGTAASDTAGGAGTAAAVGAAALGAAAVGAAAAGAMGETEPAEDMDMGMGMGEDESMDFDIDLDSLDADDSGDAGMGTEAGAADQADDELDFDLNLDSEEGVEELSMDLNAGEEVPAADDEGLNFDLEESPGAEAGDDLSLDMDLGETGEPGEQASDAGDELNFDLDEGGLGEDASALDESMELDTADEQTAGEGLEFDLEGAGEAEAPGLDETGAEDGLSLDMDLGEAGLTEEPGLDAAEEGLSLDMDLGEEQPGDAGLTEEPGLDAAEEGLSLDMDLGEEQPGDAGLTTGAEDELSLDMGLGETDEEQPADGEFELDLSDAGLGEGDELSLDMGSDDAEQPADSGELDLDLGDAGLAEDQGAGEVELDLGDAGLAEDLDIGEAGDDLSLDMDLGEEQPAADDLEAGLGDTDQAEELSLGETGGEDELSLDMEGLEMDEGAALDVELEGGEEPDQGSAGELSLDDMGAEADLGLEEPATAESPDLSIGEEEPSEELDLALGDIGETAEQSDDSALDLDTSDEELNLDSLSDDDLSFDTDIGGQDADALPETEENALELGDAGEDDLDSLLSQLDDSDGLGLPGANEELEFDSGGEINAKFDLAQMYMDMDDTENARNTLNEVQTEGDDAQKERAKEMLKALGEPA